MQKTNAIQNTPEISFIENKTIEQVQAELIADYEQFMSAAEGRAVELERASPHRAILGAAAVQIFQAMQYVDRAGKQNLLKYSYSEFLDNIALLKGVTRLPARAATARLRFTVSAVRTSATAIPQGTRVSTEDGIYFSTDEYVEIPAGGTTVEVNATCTEAGEAGNNIATGEISTIVDPVPYIGNAENIAPTSGGAAIESDAALAERVYLAPSAYSTAGPEDSYKYLAQQHNASIGDVVATSNIAAGRVDITFIMADGSLPDATAIAGLKAHLNDKTVRPMTDTVTVSAPTEVTYSIALTYYIGRSDSAQAVTIQAAVESAVKDYIAWQRSIGRDINPSKLTALVMAAGAKRVTVTSPAYTAVTATKVAAISGTPAVSYGGLEDD